MELFQPGRAVSEQSRPFAPSSKELSIINGTYHPVMSSTAAPGSVLPPPTGYTGSAFKPYQADNPIAKGMFTPPGIRSETIPGASAPTGPGNVATAPAAAGATDDAASKVDTTGEPGSIFEKFLKNFAGNNNVSETRQGATNESASAEATIKTPEQSDIRDKLHEVRKNNMIRLDSFARQNNIDVQDLMNEVNKLSIEDVAGFVLQKRSATGTRAPSFTPPAERNIESRETVTISNYNPPSPPSGTRSAYGYTEPNI